MYSISVKNFFLVPIVEIINSCLFFVVVYQRQAIVVGDPLPPGVVYRSPRTFQRLISRLTKCRARGESITLEISEARCRQTQPIRQWLCARAAS